MCVVPEMKAEKAAEETVKKMEKEKEKKKEEMVMDTAKRKEKPKEDVSKITEPKGENRNPKSSRGRHTLPRIPCFVCVLKPRPVLIHYI